MPRATAEWAWSTILHMIDAANTSASECKSEADPTLSGLCVAIVSLIAIEIVSALGRFVDTFPVGAYLATLAIIVG